MQGQPTNVTMELTGPAVEQLASQSGSSNPLKQAFAALVPGISKSYIFAESVLKRPISRTCLKYCDIERQNKWLKTLFCVRAPICSAFCRILTKLENTFAGAQQIAVNLLQPALQLPASSSAGVGRRLLGLSSHLVTLIITPQPGQVCSETDPEGLKEIHTWCPGRAAPGCERSSSGMELPYRYIVRIL